MQGSINFIRTMLAVDTLMRREGLKFSASGLLHIYTMVRQKREPGTNLFAGNHYLRLENNLQPWTRLVTEVLDKDLYLDDFVWVSSNWNFRVEYDGMCACLRWNSPDPRVQACNQACKQ